VRGCRWLTAANPGAILSRVRIVALVAATLTATGAVVGGGAAADRSTTAYIGKAITVISGEPPTWLLETCAGYDGGSVQLGRRHRAITTHYNDGVATGFALIQRDGSWAIYVWSGGPASYGGHAKLVGSAVRRAATRWDIVRTGRKIGHTVGPDGPEAATAALTIC
jgi:hypothetical protein